MSRRFREYTPTGDVNEILNVSAQSGSIPSEDRWGNILTNTSTTVARRGWTNLMLFDGADSKIDAGALSVEGDITITAWMFANSRGEGNSGDIMNNGKLIFSILNSDNIFTFLSDGATSKFSGNNSDLLVLGKWAFVAVTRTSAGITNFYINTILNGVADQSSGTPEAGTTNLVLGNNNVQNSTFDGFLDPVKIYSGILTTQELSQSYTESKWKYGL